MNYDNEGINAAINVITDFKKKNNLTEKIADLERMLIHGDIKDVIRVIDTEELNNNFLESALIFKRLATQIDVIIHAIGILNILPHILENKEMILSLSMGAGNTGKDFDLETDIRIAEFKFISWQDGSSNTIRQNTTFIDFFNLVESKVKKKKFLYILDKHLVIKFFENRRAINSVLSKNLSARDRFYRLYGQKYSTVSQYYQDKKDEVHIIDMAEISPVIFRSRIFNE